MAMSGSISRFHLDADFKLIIAKKQVQMKVIALLEFGSEIIEPQTEAIGIELEFAARNLKGADRLVRHSAVRTQNRANDFSAYGILCLSPVQYNRLARILDLEENNSILALPGRPGPSMNYRDGTKTGLVFIMRMVLRGQGRRGKQQERQ